MKITKTALAGVMVIEPRVFGDDRGYFMETFRLDLLEKALGHRVEFVQENESKSSRGVLRGLHYQLPPYTQSKLCRVIEGRVLDVAVDIRRGSPTFGRSVAVELSCENQKQLFVPRGFAHGFLVLSETARFTYKVDNYYAPQADRGIVYNDPTIGIRWGEGELLLSDKDQSQPYLEDATLFSYDMSLYPSR